MDIVTMTENKHSISSKYCIIKIDNKCCIEKQGVIMRASFAPSFANLSILTHLIQKEIYKNRAIKIKLRMVDDAIVIINGKYDINIDNIFKQYYPKHLKFTSKNMNNNIIQFADTKLIRINDTLNYIMYIKKRKLEFFTPFDSNHPIHISKSI